MTLQNSAQSTVTGRFCDKKWLVAARRNFKYAFMRIPLDKKPTSFLATFFNNLLFHLSGMLFHDSAWQAHLQCSGSCITSSDVFPYHPVTTPYHLVCPLPHRLSQRPA